MKNLFPPFVNSNFYHPHVEMYVDTEYKNVHIPGYIYIYEFVINLGIAETERDSISKLLLRRNQV